MVDKDFVEAFAQRGFPQMLRTFVEPEIIRRQAGGQAPKPYPLRKAQVLFHPDGRPPEVRLNDEVRGAFTATLPSNHRKVIGDTLAMGEIEAIEDFALDADDDQDCGHFTFLMFRGKAFVAFDARYNKRRARLDLANAEDFLEQAVHALELGRLAPFVEELFAAAELAARAMLLTRPDAKLLRSKNHRAIRARVNLEAKLGNLTPGFARTLNKLSFLRQEFRYERRVRPISDSSANEMLEVVRTMLEAAKEWVQ